MADVTLPPGFACRPLEAADIEAVFAIEAGAFTTPWQPETFEGLLDRDTVEMRVMTDESAAVVGYAVLWCILDQGELANLAIVPELRGRGLGAHLLRHVLQVARGRQVEKFFLEVRASNAPAIALYERFGFAEIGVRRAYYDTPKEDAIVMAVSLTEAALSL